MPSAAAAVATVTVSPSAGATASIHSDAQSSRPGQSAMGQSGPGTSRKGVERVAEVMLVDEGLVNSISFFASGRV